MQRAQHLSNRPDYVKVKNGIVMLLYTIKFVPVVANLPEGTQGTCMEQIELIQSNPEGSLHPIEAII
jgi:hypothetical protein